MAGQFQDGCIEGALETAIRRPGILGPADSNMARNAGRSFSPFVPLIASSANSAVISQPWLATKLAQLHALVFNCLFLRRDPQVKCAFHCSSFSLRCRYSSTAWRTMNTRGAPVLSDNASSSRFCSGVTNTLRTGYQGRECSKL